MGDGQLELLTQLRVRQPSATRRVRDIFFEASMTVAIGAAMIKLHFAENFNLSVNIPYMLHRLEHRMIGLLVKLWGVQEQEALDYWVTAWAWDNIN
ncbi:hypothetical protein EN45_045980 [Penicillium chrysogenum]|jgi:hypothetical protein|uniref:Uncharacterized protein n=1 Tax=Penicillium chrysogenum TaxID=5076 RepID=A0A167YQE5_PENCH|nr:uncharacterized protein N7525_010119 [Penicillium rubens]KAJ5820835.1 hypothetical protein N7525_010119 [Penicillium rubens]KZN94401.1 hypothetical protein EN45_045980 [Penicillium chrysogenum]